MTWPVTGIGYCCFMAAHVPDDVRKVVHPRNGYSQKPTLRRPRTTRRQWRAILYRKRYTMESWDWKNSPKPFLSALLGYFGIRPRFAGLDPEQPERWLHAVAGKHGLHVYDPPSIDGSDVYGFIVSKQRLSRREIQQIEADHWGETFDTVWK